jgi:uncharacterized cupin superfamily protein
MTQHQIQPRRAGAVEVLTGDPGSVLTLLADPEHTGGTLTANRSLLRAGSAGAPPHLHRRSAEMFYLLGGVLDVLVDEEVTTLEPGDLLVVPAGTAHAFAPAAGRDADVLVVFTPGTARFDYYRLLDGLHRGTASAQDVRDSQQRFDNHYVESAAWSDRPGR